MQNKLHKELIPSAIWVLMIIFAAFSTSDFGKSKISTSNTDVVREANTQSR
jgi:hypothetical protein